MKSTDLDRREPPNQEKLRSEMPEIFAKVPRSVLYADISAGAVRTFAVIYDREYRKTRRAAEMSQKRLGELLGTSRETTQRYLAELEAHEFITVERLNGTINRYQTCVISDPGHQRPRSSVTQPQVISDAGLGQTEVTSDARNKRKEEQEGGDGGGDPEAAAVDDRRPGEKMDDLLQRKSEEFRREAV